MLANFATYATGYSVSSVLRYCSEVFGSPAPSIARYCVTGTSTTRNSPRRARYASSVLARSTLSGMAPCWHAPARPRSGGHALRDPSAGTDPDENPGRPGRHREHDARDTPIAEIGELTALLDDAAQPLIEVMELCQVIASGLPRDASSDGPDDALLSEVAATVGWPLVRSHARAALAGALADTATSGLPYSRDYLVTMARTLSPLASHDVGTATEHATARGRSRDAVALQVLVGTRAQLTVVAGMLLWAHASAAIADQSPVACAGDANPRPAE